MAEPRRYRSDDRDLASKDLELVAFSAGNGDWYVGVWSHGHKIGPTVRVTTSGTPSAQRDVPLAVAGLYDALGGKPPRCTRCTELLFDLQMEGVGAKTPSEWIGLLAEERNKALDRARTLSVELEKVQRALIDMSCARDRLAHEVEEAEPLAVLKALYGAPESVEVEPGCYRAMSVGERVKWLADEAFGRTVGDRINARARAGAERVDAEEALARLKKDDQRRPAAERRLELARAAEKAARRAETAALEHG